jgi:hypothetical protein
MSALSVTPVDALAGVGAVLVVVLAWRSGARRARAAAEAARTGGRLVSLVGRVLVTAGLIVGAEWVVVAHGGRGWLLVGVLGVPALLAAYTLTRALTMTTDDLPRRRRGGRR